MMIQKISALNAAPVEHPQATKVATPAFEGTGRLTSAGKTMKALALAGMMGMAAVAMSSCAQPTGPVEEPTTTGEVTNPTNPTTPVTVQSPVQAKMLEMFQAVGLLDSLAKGNITDYAYYTQARTLYTGTLDKENSTENMLVYKSYEYSSPRHQGNYITTILKTDEGILTRDSRWDDCSRLFVIEDGGVSEYIIDDVTGTKDLACKFKKSTKKDSDLGVYDINGCYAYDYHDFDIKTAE